MLNIKNIHQKNFDNLLKNESAFNNLKKHSLKEIANQWYKFMAGEKVDQDIVSELIFKSWQRSKKHGVDPYHKSELLSQEEIKTQIKNNEVLVRKFGNIVFEMQKLARKKGLVIQLFNKEAKNVQLIAYANFFHQELGIKNAIFSNAAECDLGTNAVCLAIQENRALQVLGPEHFNYYFHNTYCSAAPIHNSNGDIIGAINIASYSHKNSIDSLLLVIFLSKLFDNISVMLDAMDELQLYNFAFDSIIECLPNGLIYVNDKNEIKCYNNKLIGILGINSLKNINDELNKLLLSIKNRSDYDDFNKDMIKFSDNLFNKNLLVTIQKINHPNKPKHEKLILIEEHKTNNEFNDAIYTFNDIVGNNEKIVAVKELAQKVAKSNASILIFGENGTGKELFAQAIHNASVRKGNPFVAINCGAIPNELVESELFGYEAGAFTGALKGGKKGKLELASGGTLFLDEIESMPLDVQIKLLRVLSTNRICRVGGLREIPIDIRIISATKKDLLEEADNGCFREDLYYRISTMTVMLPALRERADDIPLLIDYYIQKYSRELNLYNIKINPIFYEALSKYSWRGNVRELNNVIERALLLLDEEMELNLSQLPEKIIKSYNYKDMKNMLRVITNQNKGNDNLLKLSEEIIIELLLQEENGILSKVAERLGISRQTLYNKIKHSKKLKRRLHRN